MVRPCSLPYRRVALGGHFKGGMIDAVAQSLADVTISHFTSQLSAVDEAITQTIDNDSVLRRKRDLLLSISGVGETLAGVDFAGFERGAVARLTCTANPRPRHAPRGASN
jgi:hypothetical protein